MMRRLAAHPSAGRRLDAFWPSPLLLSSRLVALWPQRDPAPRVAQVSVRWSAGPRRRGARQLLEQQFSLTGGEPNSNRSADVNVWNYALHERVAGQRPGAREPPAGRRHGRHRPRRRSSSRRSRRQAMTRISPCSDVPCTAVSRRRACFVAAALFRVDARICRAGDAGVRARRACQSTALERGAWTRRSTDSVVPVRAAS